ncbi:CRISPR-associated protein Cas4 [Paenibacillus larvae]|uniref:CRISPR-associated protein Cas4 n=1 Tax=Paenibacillus larvae TaxID=1464 RepID=UPI00227F8BE9|nr:CRISPR-associated protein Cas4 [Paenibacillus larvae]MCY9512039.1 CRISPR-associated protein Cas4 [Paenibacillus larvae]MCY9525788.1 CRISPR-associated protein Cas4 [Paenibacillus larvae]
MSSKLKETDTTGVTGTLVWYYYICHREVWLQSRQIVADQADENMDWGRFLHENSYAREKKEISWESIKMDTLSNVKGQLVVAEVKKTSSYLQSAKMQTLFYLYNLKQAGVNAVGELRFPEEKRRETVILDEEAEMKIEKTIHNIRRILVQEKPPQPKKIKFCGKCAYREFCWA